MAVVQGINSSPKAIITDSMITVAMISSDVVHIDTAAPIKRSRQSKPKVKTGCLTCKIRRIKCDELKPACDRCTSTGRKCDGYPPKPTIAKQHLLLANTSTNPLSSYRTYPQSLSNPLLNFPGTSTEQRSLSFFAHRTAPSLSYTCPPLFHFWTSLIPCVAASEPTIQHAMTAVASLHERFESPPSRGSSAQQDDALFYHPETVTGRGRKGTDDEFALKQYNKAIASLTKRLREGGQSEEVTLMCCALFISLEYLRGNVTSAISHLRSGIDILMAWPETATYHRLYVSDGNNNPDSASLRADDDLSIPASPTSTSVPAMLSKLFTRISIQSLLCGHASTTQMASIAEVTAVASWADGFLLDATAFWSYEEAHEMLMAAMKHSVRFLCLAAHFKYLPDSEERRALDPPRRALLGVMERWGTAWGGFVGGQFSPSACSSTSTTLNSPHQSLDSSSSLSSPLSDPLVDTNITHPISPPPLSPTLNLSHPSLRPSLTIRIQSLICIIWLNSALTNTESIWDTPEIEALFREAVHLATILSTSSTCSNLINHTSTPNSGNDHESTRWRAREAQDTPSFSFNMGIIPTLFFVATKCRILSVRRAALGILVTTMPRREGPWDAGIAGTVAARVIEIEEEGGSGSGKFDDSQRKTPAKGAQPVDLEFLGDAYGRRRVARREEGREKEKEKEKERKSRAGSRKRVADTIVNRRFEIGEDGERRQKVTFLIRPFEGGEAGAWMMRKEMLLWTREEEGWKPRHEVLETEWTPRDCPPNASKLGHLIHRFYP